MTLNAFHLRAAAATVAMGFVAAGSSQATGFRHDAAANAEAAVGQAGQGGLPLWSRSFSYKSRTYSYTMVGADPAKGASTTTVPVYLVPVAINFADGTVLDAGKTPTALHDTADNLLIKSPLFASVAFKSGKTNLGVSQYIDAFQRGNFWGDLKAHSTAYHVNLAAPTVLPPLTLKPGALGQTYTTGSIKYGATDFTFTDNAAVAYMKKNKTIKPTGFVIFLTYNDLLSQGGTPAYCGYHSAIGAQTYTVTMLDDPGICGWPNDANTATVSHEIGEWMDDPLINNAVPGGDSRTHGLIEVGDSLSANIFDKTANGVVFHLQDLSYHDYFTCAAPSTSANGWYSFANHLASRGPNC